MKFFYARLVRSGRTFDCERLLEDQLWNPYALGFCTETGRVNGVSRPLFVAWCSGAPFRAWGALETDGIPYLRVCGLAACLAAQRLPAFRGWWELHGPPCLVARLLGAQEVRARLPHLKRAQKRRWRWLERVRAARAARSLLVVAVLLRKIPALTPDNVEMILAQLTLAPEDQEHQGAWSFVV